MPRSKKRREAGSKGERGRERENNSRFIKPIDILNPVVAKTEGQQHYLESIEDCPITICDGPAGCGKSFLSFGKALEYYLSPNSIERIVVVRSTYPAGDEPDIGYLPGTLNDKMAPLLAPLLKDSARQLIKKVKKDYEVQSLLSSGGNPTASIMQILLSKFDIEIVPLQFMRGRTFDNAFVILDEGQNCSLAEFKLFLTRIGMNSKVVIEGDSTQRDRADGALPELMRRLEDMDSVGLVYMDSRDIVRSPIIADIIERL